MIGVANPPPLQRGRGTAKRWRGTVPHALESKSHVFVKQLRRKMTDAEVILWQHLRRNAVEGLRFCRQHPIGPFVVDFACLPAKLIVEVDGATHGTEEEQKYDARRRKFTARFGWREIRVGNSDVYENLSGVLEYIWREVTARVAPSTASRSPSPAKAGEDKRRRR